MDTEAAPDKGQRARRRTFLIDRKFQMKWTLIIVSVGVLVSGALGYFIVRLNAVNTALLGLDEVMDAGLAEQVSKYDLQAIYYLIGFVLVMALFLFVWGIFMTHRVAGPIFIISRYLTQMSRGEVPRPRPLRKGDELQEFFGSFSAMLERQRSRSAEEVEVLGSAVTALKEKGGADSLVEQIESLIGEKKSWTEDA